MKTPMKKNTKNLILLGVLIIFTQGFYGCAALTVATEAASAGFLEQPSMELVLDRLNTASAAAELATVTFNDVPISDTSTWPKELNSMSGKDIMPVFRALALDGAYASHGGLISPVKAHVVLSQNVLYIVPPDMYSSAGSCYKKGESTIINGYYYKINSYNDIEYKDKPSGDEIERAVKMGAENIFITTKCRGSQTLVKRKGKLKPQSGGVIKQNIMQALYDILPNGKAIKAAYKEYDKIKKELLDIAETLAVLAKDKTKVEDGEKPVRRYSTVADIEEQIAITLERKEEAGLELEERTMILKQVLENISEYKGEVTKPSDLKTLRNIIEACKAVEGLLGETVGVTTIAIAKLPQSIMNIHNEIKQMGGTAKGVNLGGLSTVKAAYLPLRLARLRFNTGNVLDNIKAIVTVIMKETTVIATIHMELDDLLSIEIAGEEGDS